MYTVIFVLHALFAAVFTFKAIVEQNVEIRGGYAGAAVYFFMIGLFAAFTMIADEIAKLRKKC